jgi:CheY-like chemotaxis protein
VHQESEPDLVVSDVEMPRMDGFALLTEIRKRTQRLPVVMLTTRRRFKTGNERPPWAPMHMY